MNADVSSIPSGDFSKRLAAYEKAVLEFREELRLSGMTTQCWTEQEEVLKHVPCFINARMAARGFPIACENDVHSSIAELLGQYATNQSAAAGAANTGNGGGGRSSTSSSFAGNAGGSGIVVVRWSNP